MKNEPKKISVNLINLKNVKVKGLKQMTQIKRDKRINFKELYQIRFLSGGIAVTIKTNSAKRARKIIEAKKDDIVHVHSDRTASQLFLDALLRQIRDDKGIIE